MRDVQGERVIRSDIVAFSGWVSGGWWPDTPRRGASAMPHLAVLTITRDQFIFGPPPVPRRYRVLWWFAFVPFLSMFWQRWPPLPNEERFDLTAIEEFHTWQPPFSGPPMFQIGRDGWSFQLMSGGYPWKWRQVASKDEMREHFEALRPVWKAARARAASSPDAGSIETS